MNAKANQSQKVGSKINKPLIPHILIVEDEAPQRAMLRELFEGEGFFVSEAKDGKEGLSKVEQLGCGELSLIVVDLIMPKVGGIAFIRRAHEECPENCPPILVCTARREREMVELARQRKVNDYILKPYKMELMLERVRKLLAD